MKDGSYAWRGFFSSFIHVIMISELVIFSFTHTTYDIMSHVNVEGSPVLYNLCNHWVYYCCGNQQFVWNRDAGPFIHDDISLDKSLSLAHKRWTAECCFRRHVSPFSLESWTALFWYAKLSQVQDTVPGQRYSLATSPRHTADSQSKAGDYKWRKTL